MNKSKRKEIKQSISMLLCLALVMSYMPMTSLVVQATEVTNVMEGGSKEVSPSKPVMTRDKYDMDGDEVYDEVYEIGTAEELYWFAGLVNGTLEGVEVNQKANGVLTADITINENLLSSLEFDAEGNVTNGDNYAVWDPIGNFKNYIRFYEGIFDGKEHTISGLYFNDKNVWYVGLFGYSQGEIRNVTVADSYFVGNSVVGGILGLNNNIVKNCTNEGEVTGTEQVGGVVGYNGGTVGNCTNEGEVTGTRSAGGVAGYNSGTLGNCNNEGKVSGNQYIGGIVGDSERESTIQNCTNVGEVTGTMFVGGVAGDNGGTVGNCTNEGKVTGTRDVGGIVGVSEGESIIENCINVGEVTGTMEVGGVAGCSLGKVIKCSNEGYVAGEGRVAGVVGYNAGTVSDSDNIGNVKGDRETGGVAGDNAGTVSNSNNAGKVEGGRINLVFTAGVGGVAGSNTGTVSDSNNTGKVEGDILYAGGVVGYNNGGNVKNCSNSETVDGRTCAGGIVGWNDGEGTVKNCYNISTVMGAETIGGVLGLNEATVENCHSNGRVVSYGEASQAGAIAGENYGSFKNCIYDKDKFEGDAVGSNSGTLEAVEGKTSKEFQEYDICKALGYHMGGIATCQKEKVCINCGETYGEKNPENHEKTSEDVWEQIQGSVSKHYRTCTYDSQKYIEEHSFNSETGVCESCGYQAEVSINFDKEQYEKEYVYYNSLKKGCGDILQKYKNSTLTLYKNVTFENASDSFIIEESDIETRLDLNGFTLSGNVDAPIKVKKGSLTVLNDKSEGSIKTSEKVNYAILVEDEGILNIESGIVSSIGCSGGTVNLSGSPVVASLKTEGTGTVCFKGELKEGASISFDNHVLGAVVAQGTKDYVITESDAEKSYSIYEKYGFKPVLENNQLIMKRDLSNAMVTLNPAENIYTGSANEPQVVIEVLDIAAAERDKKITLEKDKDYIVSYNNNINAGTATVTIEGKGNYIGILKKEFAIKKASVAPGMPEASMEVADSFKKIGSIILPESWEWQEKVKEISLKQGVPVKVTAFYNGADEGNYEKEIVDITVTRSFCNHEKEIINEKAATCKVEGYTGDTYCKVCEETVKYGITAPLSTVHTWDEGEITKESTCTEAGEKTYTCKVCETTKKEEVTKKSHIGGNATCTKKAVCTICQNEYGELDKKNHVETELRNGKEATCKEEGYTGDTYCKNCDEIIATGEKTDKLTTHTWNEGEITKESTCTEAGEKTYICKVCETTKKEEVTKKSHTGGIATCTKKAVCTICQNEYGELDKKNHVETELRNGKEATCKEEGYTGDTYCKDCDEKISIGEIISKTEHRWDDGVVTKEATATEKGIKTYTCTACQETKTEEIPATGEAVITKIPGEVITPEKPTVTPSATSKPTEKPSKEEPAAPKKGTVLTDKKSNGKYKVLVSSTKNGTVEYVKPLSKKSTKANIPATVKINGITYKVVSIAKNAFKNHKAIAKITIGANVKTIGANAFYGCKKLKTVSIGKNVTTIGDKAFYKCTALTKITIPSKVKKIGKQSFYGCKKLKTITIKTTKLTKKNVGSKAFTGIYKKATIKVPKSKVKTYQKLLKTKGVSKSVTVKK